jgi:CheY-like chemotaxis protein
MTHRRILVVDDEEDIQEVLRATLEILAGWEVLKAGSGREGVAMAAAEQPDVILLDVMMPEMDGPATFRRLQADAATRHIPVILLTARVLTSDQRVFAELGVPGFIAKPFDPLTITRRIADLLGWTA